MGGDEQDELGMGMVWARSIIRLPNGVAETRSRGADIRMAIVAINTPCLENALDIAFVTWSTNVVDDFIMSAFLQRPANAVGDQHEHFRPGDRLPFPAAAWADTPQRLENAVGIVDLVDSRWTFSAEPASAGWMKGIALELTNFIRIFIYIGE